ncbi:AB hydrolase superfamily protein [Fusarium oxysporum f. sp. cubense]|uniref:AB hydrolase superfamily protein n=1 Tax=Fusarium oxysporum f. sp. cubense TaxID=61366 RepID=A0A559L5E7_FUSOC|nr:AB hydrolase superfamily protein [Fusarium oxysporum f. sp. cubense]
MTLQTFDVNKPKTWHLAATINDELQEMIENGTKGRFTGDAEHLTLAQTRAKFDSLFQQDADVLRSQMQDEVSEQEIHIPVRDGFKVRALVYRRKTDQSKTDRPLVVLIHGGGFILGNAEMEMPTCVEAVRRYDCVAVSLEYRLSPEVKFPVAYNDCWDALTWLSKNATTLQADPTRGFVFGGTSAGSHLSIPLAHQARDEKLSPPITGLYHCVPPALMPQALTDKYKPLYNSREQLKDGMALNAKSTEVYDKAVEPDFASPLWNPLLWPTGHRGLPPSFFQICGADLLRDEALIYERELRLEGGVKTKTVLYEGLPHVFWYDYPTHSASARFAKDAVDGLGWLLGREK